MNIGTIHGMVLETLKRVPQTRSSDRVLISEIYTNYYEVGNMAFWKVMETPELGLPSFETITRCRRKIQETHPELRAVEAVEGERNDKQMDFKEYANGGVIA